MMVEYGRDRHDTAEARVGEWERLERWLKSRKREREKSKKDAARERAAWLRSLDGRNEQRGVAKLYSASKDGGSTWTEALPAYRLGDALSIRLGAAYYHCSKLERVGNTIDIGEIIVRRVR